MKLIVWMIQEIFKILNQFAVDIPTLPVNLCLSRLIQFLVECKAVFRNAEPQRWAAKHLGHAWKIRKVFAGPVVSSTAPYPQGFNPWISNVSEHTSPHVMSEHQTPDTTLDQRCQSGPSARSSVIPSEGDFFKEVWGRPTTTADFRSSFWEIHHTRNSCLLEDKIQDWGVYLCTTSNGS